MIALQRKWTDVAVNSLCTARGLSILDALLLFPDEIPIISTFDPRPEIFADGRNITPYNMISELLRTECSSYSINRDVCNETIEISRAELVAALPITQRPTSPRPDDIRICNFRIPRDIGMHAVCEEDESGPLWNSSLCLMGSLADIHLDCCGITQLIVNIQCNQLWLLWPATAHNLSWWSIHIQSSHEISTVDAINGMCGLEMLYVKEPQAFILPPYHFHAVITFDTSIHAKVSLWGFQWLEQFRRGFKWVIDFATNYQRYDISSEEAERMLVSAQKNGLDGWMTVAKTFSDQPHADELRDWVASAAEGIQNALMIIHTS